MKPLFLSLISLCAINVIVGAAPAKLTFIKSFPGSTPAFVFVEVDRAGALLYKEALDDQQPLKAVMKEVDVTPLFSDAEKLNFFREPIESGLKVANTGKKIFRYQPETGAVTETTFNYSTNPVAQELLDKFEQIAESERAYIELDRAIHFDKLGVNDALAQLEAIWLKKQLAAPEQFVTLLTRVATHEAFMHLVRDRAAKLRDEFTGSLPATANTEQKSQK